MVLGTARETRVHAQKKHGPMPVNNSFCLDTEEKKSRINRARNVGMLGHSSFR